ncbi:hypothetical protein C0993_011615 [Termitomyces sp. T159_Od127]|nr:hypothetical protein C0993_011615 [Termitomyces sp. T159_Od127]
MVANVVAGRDAVAQNTLPINQTEQPQPQVGKKKRKTAAPVDSVPTSPDDLSQLVSRLISRVDNLEEGKKQQRAEIRELKEENKKRREAMEQNERKNGQQLAQKKEDAPTSPTTYLSWHLG